MRTCSIFLPMARFISLATVLLLSGLTGCQESPSANKSATQSLAVTPGLLVDGRKLYNEMGISDPACGGVSSNFPFDPLNDARKNFAAGRGYLFAESGTDMGFSIVWGLMDKNNQNVDSRYRDIILKHGATNFTTTDTCPEKDRYYEIVLGSYNKEILRLLSHGLR